MPPTKRQRLTRAESRARTRAELLDAAEHLFAEQGFHATALEDVAERAGYTRGAVYWNFKDKDDLFAAVVERRSTERLEAIARLRSAARDGQTFLDALNALDAAGGDAEANRRWHLLAVEQLAYALRNPQARERLAEREHAINQAMGQLAAAVYAERNLKPPLPPHELGVVVHALDWGLRAQRQLNAAEAPTALLYNVLELLLASSQPLPKPPHTSTRRRAPTIAGRPTTPEQQGDT